MAENVVTGKAFEDVDGIKFSVSDNLVHLALKFDETRGLTINMTPYMVRHVIENLEKAESVLLAQQGAGEGNGLGRIINLHANVNAQALTEALDRARHNGKRKS